MARKPALARKKPALAGKAGFGQKEAGFWPEKPALSAKSRLTPAYAGSYIHWNRRRLTPAYAGFFWPEQKPAFAGLRRLPLKEPAFWPKKPALLAKSRLLLAERAGFLAKRSRLSPAFAGFRFLWAPRGRAGESRRKPAFSGPERSRLLAGKSRLLLTPALAGFGRLWPNPSVAPKEEYVTAGTRLWRVSSFLNDVVLSRFRGASRRLERFSGKHSPWRPTETGKPAKPAFSVFSGKSGLRRGKEPAQTYEWGRLI